jgi:uncharacterized protein with PIN domain
MGTSKIAGEYSVQGKKLICPICGGNLFFTRRSLLNTAVLTFFDLDWANKRATNYICQHCGHIMWFAER